MQLTYLSHSCIKLSHNGYTLLVDPFLTHNTTAPCTWEEAAAGTTHILLTHGHGDHVGDTVKIAGLNNIPVLAIVELAVWLGKQGVKDTIETNFGGTINLGQGASVTLVPAWHTSASNEGEYLGTPAGLVITLGDVTVYHAGDTSIFGDMALINELYNPDVVLLPVGGVYTMDAKTAAFAAKKYFAGAKTIIPLHYATFPVLAPDASEFTSLVPTARALKPGESLTF